MEDLEYTNKGNISKKRGNNSFSERYVLVRSWVTKNNDSRTRRNESTAKKVG